MYYGHEKVLTHNLAHGHFGGMQVACLLWQRVSSEKFPSRRSLSGGFGKEAFLCVPLILGSKQAVCPKSDTGGEVEDSISGRLLHDPLKGRGAGLFRRFSPQPTHQLNDIDGGSNSHMTQM